MTHKEHMARIRAFVASPTLFLPEGDDDADRQKAALTWELEEQRAQMKQMDARIAELERANEQTRKATENLERQWQSYINTLPKQ